MSLFFAGSSSDLCHSTIKKLGIECVNYPYKKNDDVHFYDEDFDFGGFYSKLRKGTNFDCANLNEEEYIKIFEQCLAQGDDVIFVHSSENIISANALKSAKAKLEEKYKERKLCLIDSKNISVGEGIVAYLCAMLYRKGEDLQSIEEKSIDIINESAFFFSTNNTSRLEKNLIIDKPMISGGTALNIKPIWTINIDGNVELFDKVSGKKKCVAKLLEIIRQMGENVVDYPISIVYTYDENSANDLKNKIIETFGNDAQVTTARMTPNNAMLLGEDIIGLAFHVHRKIH